MIKKLGLMLLVAAVVCTAIAAQAKSNGKAVTISALEAWDMLMGDTKNTFLVDVRTRAEYVLQGHPVRAYNVPWRFFSDHLRIKGQANGSAKAEYTGYQLEAKPNPAFVGVMQSLFKPKDRLVLISTNGSGAKQAAQSLLKGGFGHIYIVRHGYLGDRLVSKKQSELAVKLSPLVGRRGRVNGWVFWGLPITYNVDPRYVYPPDLKRMQSGE